MHRIYQDREKKARQILLEKGMPKPISEKEFLVSSQNSDRKYIVNNFFGWACECQDFRSGHKYCKHILAVKLWLKTDANKEIKIAEEKITEEICVECKSRNLVKNGKKKTKVETKQRFKCRDCGKRFVQTSLRRVKGNARIVTLALDLYFKGLSLRDISDTILQFYNLSVHFDTIRRWIVKFTKIMNDYVKQFKPQLGNTWHLDEQMVKSGKDWRYCWNMIDFETRFLIANNVTQGREVKDARKLLKKAKELTSEKPKVFITDGLQSYKKALTKEYDVTRGNKISKSLHLYGAGIRDIVNNNIIERYHNEFREFDKVRRGFKSDKTAQEWSEAFRLYHNFIKKHMSLSELTPAEFANIDLKLNGNKWLGLLVKAVKV